MSTELSVSYNMPSTDTEPPASDDQGSIQFASASSSPEQYDVIQTDVSTSRRSFLPPLLKELLPWMAKAVKEVSLQHDIRLLKGQKVGMVDTILQNEYDVTAIRGWYAFAAATFTLKFGDLPSSELPSPEENDTLANLIRIGTGTDESSSGFDELAPGPVRLLDICSRTVSVALYLDEEAWRNTRRSQREEALRTFNLFATACDIDLVVAPTLEEFLRDRHPTWCDQHLTQNNNTQNHEPPGSSSNQHEVDRQAVYNRLRSLSPGGGRLQLLGAVPLKKGNALNSVI
ncbi:hypothetical protein KTS45_11085 [Halomicroarcula limicola]|uniref:Uncharacterized protein n=1 Tax=Haloarcula limicola TaxID=1429915 RepID=A0A8J7YDY6_9EURY|nr:hypothetical protein [Halomicroarcula limicola]MBV0924743.1 hypothetical protein [Halomicroarcula limicola]